MEKHAERAFLALVLAVLLAVPAGTVLWGRRDTTSYYENRTLAARPDLTAGSLWDGSFGERFESWFADHAPGRTTLLKADAAAELRVLRRPVVNGIVTGGDVLVPMPDFQTWSQASYAATAAPIAERFAKLSAHVEENGGRFYFAGFPEQLTYFSDQYPEMLRETAGSTAVSSGEFQKAMTGAGVTFLDMGAVYDDQGHPSSYYSAVDHHYTYYGAYAAYRFILDTLAADGFDLPVLTEEDLDFQELPNPNIGSRNRKLYNLWPNTERAVIGVQRDPVAFTRYDNGALSDKPLFVLPAAEDLPIVYGLYMGGDFGETVMKTDRPELPNALIFGDSFTNALETLLYASFNETHSLDLRHYTDKSLKDYISDYQPDVVLCVMNDTFYYTTTGNGAVWED